MERKEFLVKSLKGLGFLASSPLIAACTKSTVNNNTTDEASTTAGSTNGSSSSDCEITNAETAGPFPIKNPASLVLTDIKGDRSGVPLTVNLIIKNKNTGCGVLANALVDIWHCDAAGQYSEYGGTGLQSVNLTNVHWLRGRQTTNADGAVVFSSIFPGWYSGRAPHIHVHVYNSSGKSLLVTQIAFPKEICDNVYTNGSDYKSKGLQDTTNSSDNVFRDGFENELAAISGSVADGYILNHTVVVSA